MTTPPALVLYHGNCPDGFASMLAAYLALGPSAQYVPAVWGQPLPDLQTFAGRRVWVLDFCLSRAMLEQVCAVASGVTLLDHHASAFEMLNGFEPQAPHRVTLDLKMSGAALAWREFHPGKPLPYLFECIQARDLWQWEGVARSREFLRWLDTQPRTIECWQALLEMTPEQLEQCCEKGKAMTVLFEHMVDLVLKGAQPCTVFGHQGLMVNTNFFFNSEVGELMAKQCEGFALLWRVDGQTVRCALRSAGQYSVRPLAERLGGGGHDRAAAFRLPLRYLPRVCSGRLEFSQEEIDELVQAAAAPAEPTATAPMVKAEQASAAPEKPVAIG